MFPYSLLILAMMMYLPALIWRFLAMPSLGSDLLFIIDELDKSYNRSIIIAQSIVELREKSSDPLEFKAVLERSGQDSSELILYITSSTETVNTSRFIFSSCIHM